MDKSLEESTKELQECQKSKELDSCFDCPDVLECTIRIEYVNAVYKSMNSENEGGFEF